MNATDLQKLRREVELAQKHGTTPDISAWDLFEVLSIAERAVSPAESVQSIDGAVFQGLLADYCDAYCALNGGEERTMDCMDSLLGYLNIKIAAAHAEGRRSALEELHPQWLKEKERADRAEEALVEWYKLKDPASLHVNLLRGIPARLTTEQLLHIAGDGAQALAARQAPDLDSLQRYVATPHDKRGMREEKLGAWVLLSDVQARLSSTAQPLQQEGGKETLANGWPKDFHEVVKGAEDASYQLGHAAGLEEAAQVCERDAASNVLRAGAAAADRCASAIRALASDNLQQASTAQGEPVPVGCPDLGDAEEFSEMLAGHAGLLTQAIEMVDGCMDDTMVEPKDAAAWQIVKKHIRPAQATPEGADLPPPDEYCASKGIYAFGPQQMRDYARAALAATTAAEPVAWTDDAEKWGNALNEAGWEFIEVCPEKSTTLFNHVKPALRAAILKYASVVSRAATPQQVGTNGLPG